MVMERYRAEIRLNGDKAVEEGVGLKRTWLMYEDRRGRARGIARLANMARKRMKSEVKRREREKEGGRGKRGLRPLGVGEARITACRVIIHYVGNT